MPAQRRTGSRNTIVKKSPFSIRWQWRSAVPSQSYRGRLILSNALPELAYEELVNPGSIVRCRNRDWVLLPSERDDVHLLRPLAGALHEVVAVHKQLTDLIGYDLPEERVRPSRFEPPLPEDLADAASAHLLWQAARLTLREGATPFRSLGRITIRPRVYQFVPLLMALRLDSVRMLVADDVGVGKTIEALLIARELLDRGEARRL